MITSPHLQDSTIIKNVNLYSSDGVVEKVTLPIKKDSDKSYSYKFKVEKQSDVDSQYINVNNFYSSFYIYCDGTLIYKNLCEEGIEGGSFDLITIKDEYFNKQLKIEFRSNLDSDRDIKIPPIMIGSKISIIDYFIDESFTKTYSSGFLFVTAIFLFILALIFFKIKHSAINIFLIAFFTLDLACYIFVRAWIMYYYLHNSILLNCIEYTSLITMPLPIYLLFLSEFYEKKYYTWRTKIFEFSSLAIIINLIVQSYLVASEQSRFVLMQPATFSLLIYSAFCIPIVLITVNKKIIEHKMYHLISIMPFGILITLGFINYFKTFTVSYTPYMIFATVFFLAIHFVLATKEYIKYMNVSIKKDFYANLAYIDVLTGINNRNAFDLKVESIMSRQENFKNMYLFMIDMNGLKSVNDSYGHYTGDSYIKEIGLVLSDLEKSNQNITAYRYAGDEFILIAYDKSKDEVKQIISFIEKRTSEYKLENCDYYLSVALGYAHVNKAQYKSDDFNIHELIKIADKYMYINKAKDKEIRNEV